MQIEKLPDEWLFERHSRQTIQKWLQLLRYFYFKRGWGGHANDGEEFQVAFSFADRPDLINKIGQLGLALNVIPDNFPRSMIGQSYGAAEFNMFKSELERFPDVEQPGHSTIFGHSAFV